MTLETSHGGRPPRASVHPATESAPDASSPAGAQPARPPRGAMYALRAGLLLATTAGLAYVACAVWQAGELARDWMQLARQARVAAPAPPTPRSERPAASPASAAAPPPSAAPMTLVAVEGQLGRTAPAAFEARAEASEKVIPVGLESAVLEAEEALVLGEAPPASYPRAACEDVFVYIVSIAEGAPRRSAASLGLGKDGPARLRSPGARLGDWTVLAITDDWTGLSPNVWLEKDGSVCKAKLAGNPARVHVAPRPPAPKQRKARKARKRRRR